jgi:macrolide transport system ATP-binding/permease protein
MTAVIHLQTVRRHYTSGDTVVKALDDVSLTIQAGEFVAIMGQSGSGKSTLMNVIGCLDRADNGSYHVLGQDVAQLDSDALSALRRETFGFIFQRYNLLANATARENVEVPALYAGTSPRERHQRAEALLEELGLGGRGGHRPSQLSGGQQQRVAIARALMNDPPVILADEPTGALDSKSGQEVMALLTRLNEQQQRTVILITHDEAVARHARRIIRIQDGQIVDDTGPDPQATAAELPRPDVHHAGSLSASGIEAGKTALRNLRVNLFRTALTLLGIVIGVAAVITMLAVGSGSKQRVMDEISAMGTNLLNIRPGAPGIRSGGDIATLIAEDATAIAALPNVSSVVPQRTGGKTLRFGNIDYASTVEGVGERFPQARDWPVTRGSFFTQQDIRSYAAVAVLGSTVAETLFPDQDPLGQFLLVGTSPFEVIGVMSSKGAAPWGGDQDDRIYVPYTTGQIRLFGSNYLNSITVKVDDAAQISHTESAIRDLLITRHRAEDFSVRNTASFLEMATATQNTLTILLGTVASISLLVGGIGVMNIMLVSVVERTREIGIRVATGARMRDIMIQFVTEAAIVCTIGGMIGVALGISAGLMLSLFDVRVVFSAGPALLAFSSAVLTGLVFGYLPARKAARLDPVIALGAE